MHASLPHLAVLTQENQAEVSSCSYIVHASMPSFFISRTIWTSFPDFPEKMMVDPFSIL